MAVMNRLGLCAKQILKQDQSDFENKNITDRAMVKTLPNGAFGAILGLLAKVKMVLDNLPIFRLYEVVRVGNSC